jgi:hypothetical protein
MARKKHLFSWTGFYAKHLVSATVENAAPTNVVLTFAPADAVKAFKNSIAAEFTLTGKTVDLLTVSRSAGTVTVRVTVGYTAGANFNLTHNDAGKGATVVTTVTNNVA